MCVPTLVAGAAAGQHDEEGDEHVRGGAAGARALLRMTLPLLQCAGHDAAEYRVAHCTPLILFVRNWLQKPILMLPKSSSHVTRHTSHVTRHLLDAQPHVALLGSHVCRRWQEAARALRDKEKKGKDAGESPRPARRQRE